LGRRSPDPENNKKNVEEEQKGVTTVRGFSFTALRRFGAYGKLRHVRLTPGSGTNSDKNEYNYSKRRRKWGDIKFAFF